MKVLHLLKTTRYSGAENVVISIMKNCTECEMVYASPDGPIRNHVQEEGLIFYPIKKLSRIGIRQVVEAVRPDVIHAHDFSMSIYAAWASKRVPIVSHLHNNPLWIKKIHLKTLLYLWSTKRYKTILTVSNAIEQEFFLSSFFSSKIRVLENVVDKDTVLEKAKKLDESKTYDVIFLGRLSFPKNPIYFCEVIDRLKDELPNVRVAMIGSGEMEEEVRDFISTHKLEKIIDLLGFQSNPYQYLNNGKLLLVPSIWEGFGLVAVEAMILGKPVVCSGVGGLKSIVTEDCGAICSTVDEYVYKIKELLENEIAYTKASDAACKRAEAFCNYKEYMERLYGVYEDALGR